MKRQAAPLILLLLTACHRVDGPVQRIALDQAGGGPEAPIAAPDTKAAVWNVSADGRSARFGNPGAGPLLTLECRSDAVRIIRHVRSRAGEQALFPVLGSGPNARFKLDAAQVGGEWRWQGDVPLADEQLEVFHSGRLEATLPGGGSLIIPASPTPGELIARCRAAAPVSVSPPAPAQ